MTTTQFQLGIYNGGYPKRLNTEDGPMEVWVETFEVTAVTDKGRVFYLNNGSFEDSAKAEAFLKTVDSTPETAPDKWSEGDPIYGSESWDSEAEYGLACFEADAFDEPRPLWR